MTWTNYLSYRVDKDNKSKLKQVFEYHLSQHDTDLCKMSQYMSQAILLEVCTHPKPGLVTRRSNGSHQDMSILTFAMSSPVLCKAFTDLQDIGMTHKGSAKELMAKVRSYGIIAEQELLRATKGINTQRGILFAGGLISAAAGYAYNHGLAKADIIMIVKNMTAGIVEMELKNMNSKKLTAGEILYKDYGITGIRGEVEQGFPSVVNQGMPALYEAFEKKANLNDALLHTLFSLMTVVQDSNVIWRTDIQTAEEVKLTAGKIIALGSVFTEAGRSEIRKTEEYFLSRRISPGGSADLLSVTIGLYLLENKEFPVSIF